MVRLVPISGKRLVHILQAKGFQLVRKRGSHKFFYHPETTRTTVIPVHNNEDVGPGLLRKILRDIEMDVNEFDELRKEL